MLLPALLAASVGLVAPVPALAAAPDSVCRVDDSRLTEISGLVTDGSGYVVVNDGADDPDGRKIFFLNKRCKVVRTVSYPSRPRDTEDLARGPDGSLFVGDIGDNSGSRETIGLWRLAPGARKPTLFRLSYPDGAHDAEALLITPGGIPVVITKDPVTAGIYVPTGSLRGGTTTPLKRAGDVTIPVSGTSNPFGFAGRFVVTGAALSPDGTRAVLRTYADAFEFDVTQGDVVKALSGGSSRTVALPDEPQGESIAYSTDGSSVLTVSEGSDVPLSRYPLGQAGGTAPGSSSASPGAVASPSPGAGALSPGSAEPSPATASAAPVAASDRTGLPFGALAAAVTMILAGGVIGLVIARRRRTPASSSGPA